MQIFALLLDDFKDGGTTIEYLWTKLTALLAVNDKCWMRVSCVLLMYANNPTLHLYSRMLVNTEVLITQSCWWFISYKLFNYCRTRITVHYIISTCNEYPYFLYNSSSIVPLKTFFCSCVYFQTAKATKRAI